MKDNDKELLPRVDENGQVIGQVTRGEAHGGSKILHPVVHLHVFNSKGEIYLQYRPEWKTVQPCKWDTACGGHVSYGESIDIALKREVEEELGITEYTPLFVGEYIFESAIDREYVHVFKTIYDGEVKPDKQELAGGRFFSMEELAEAIGNESVTPNFVLEFNKYLA